MYILNNLFYNDELGFDDVFIRTDFSAIESRNQVNPYTSYGLWGQCTPYFVTNMDTISHPKAAKFLYKHSVPVAIYKHIDNYELDKHLDSPEGKLSFVTIGLDSDSIKNLPLVKKYGNNLLIDVPNGYIKNFYELCKKVRQEYPETWIMAGNVIDVRACIELSKIGINCARVGIGGGSVCRTSNKTGVGRKPISAIMECSQSSIKICWDGGIRSSSDICKALHAGASYVSCGRLFAAFPDINTYAPVKMPDYNSMPFSMMEKLPFYGMSSEHANNKYSDGLKEYRAAEGSYELLDINTIPVENFIKDINGSIRSYMTYAGKETLK